MFSKVSLKSFVYDLIDVFIFPNEETKKKIYDKHKIQKRFIHQNVTDTDSTSVFFTLICQLDCIVDERESTKIIFEVMKKSEVFDRLDLSDNFWDQFNVQNKKLKKKVGLFELKNIN